MCRTMRFLLAYVMCMSCSFAKRIAVPESQGHLNIAAEPDCGQIAGAVARNSVAYPECKCPKGFQSVVCGDTILKDRKFNAQNVLKNCSATEMKPRCSTSGAICKENDREFFKYAPVEEYYKKGTQARPEDPFLAQMASISNRINNLASPVAGWELVKHWNTGDEKACSYVEQAGIYRRDGRCALSFSSTERASNLSTNFQPFPRDWCGLKDVQAGYADRLDAFMNGFRFQEFKDFLNSEKECPKGIIGVGHSMGAGMITMMAVCGNNQNHFKINELYTFAAPGVSKTQLTNSLSPDGCFKGARIYSQDQWMQDPIPALSSPFGYKHPKLAEMRLKETGGKVTVKYHDCNDKHVVDHPRMATAKISNPAMHFAGAYVKRLLQVPDEPVQDDSGGKKPEEPAGPSPMR